ncbi:hypothetical protein Psta_2248 [Pirellula staleyi DSM 6068]|uniref:Uncharacterized protein n=1 Tax=Pirellula staleyi (strain ATCC 27377 / DSM 6068 / ICPB 4128) TaxID=530564 RepID=D2R2S9_PIRSD|nr:DUF2213 domain-containing protein [Pirellula staleyi]ADB16919.1 hypothetical protein Psta_2248 [Pirellula staleyi DSM 6068]
MSLQNLTFNLGGRIRYETLEGRDHIVVPTVMIVEGVLAGNSGPLMYPAAELAAAPQVWNHKPIVIGHPSEGTACLPHVLNNRKVGIILNTRWDAPKLRTEAWIDVKRCDGLDKSIIDKLQRLEKIEVSTGLYTENEPSPGVWNGKKYEAIARNYRPDHLAILTNQVGACSIADGAGMLQLNSEDGTLSRRQINAALQLFDQYDRMMNGPPVFLPEIMQAIRRDPYTYLTGGLSAIEVANADAPELYEAPRLEFENPLSRGQSSSASDFADIDFEEVN